MSDTAELVELLIAQLDRLFTEHLDTTLLRAAEAGEWPGMLWDACEAMGLPLLLVPEAAGGVGVGWAGAYAVFKLLGQHVVPLPIGETIVAARLLADAGIAVPAGPLTFAARAPSGIAAGVPWARAAGHLVLVDRGRVTLLRLDPAAITAGVNIGRDPRDTVRLDALETVSEGASSGADAALVARLGAMLRAAQMAGALAAVSAMAIDYANLRVQFGKPIGKFQAVQQSLASLACEAAAADVAAAMPARALDRGEDAAFEVAVAKIRAGEAAGTGAALGHQAHGAIGFTDEHSLHNYTRRLWSWRSEFGSERHWADRLGRVAAAAGSDLWGAITHPAEARHG